jgi:hypothetical protein
MKSWGWILGLMAGVAWGYVSRGLGFGEFLAGVAVLVALGAAAATGLGRRRRPVEASEGGWERLDEPGAVGVGDVVVVKPKRR